MTLLKCPECGKEFSNAEQACPVCGCPSSECNVVEHIEKETENKNGFDVENNAKTNTESRFAKSSLLPGESIIASAEWQIAPIIIVIVIIVLIEFVSMFL